ncbi:LysR family transcriptional regulator [Leucobacter sp. 7(1)]|uniref:LysR family transcriptional regulator n=1 Tax=Leucobacter sp. 7(1) TaxID=1255613 RepID=UPI000B351D71|nr:LysR family transcriptional regulator [Leucobacter sp. 7(1)]
MSPRLDALRALVTVVRGGSFTAAARLLGISQPAVTAQMRSLEQELGVELFVRHGRRITPSARARALADAAAPQVDQLESIIPSMEAGTGGAQRVLHLGGPAEYLTSRVVPVLPRLAIQHRAFRVVPGLAAELLNGLAAGHTDLVVSTVFPRLRGVVSVPLVDEEFVLVAAPQWRDVLPGDRPATAEELRSIPLVAYSDDLAIVRRFWRTVFERPATDLELVATIPNLQSIAVAVVAGLGMSVLPRYLIESELRRGALLALLEPETPPLNTLHLATRAGVLARDQSVRAVHEALLSDATARGEL